MRKIFIFTMLMLVLLCSQNNYAAKGNGEGPQNSSPQPDKTIKNQTQFLGFFKKNDDANNVKCIKIIMVKKQFILKSFFYGKGYIILPFSLHDNIVHFLVFLLCQQLNKKIEYPFTFIVNLANQIRRHIVSAKTMTNKDCLHFLAVCEYILTFDSSGKTWLHLSLAKLCKDISFFAQSIAQQFAEMPLNELKKHCEATLMPRLYEIDKPLSLANGN